MQLILYILWFGQILVFGTIVVGLIKFDKHSFLYLLGCPVHLFLPSCSVCINVLWILILPSAVHPSPQK